MRGFNCVEPWNGWWGRLNNLSTGFWADALLESNVNSWPVGIGGSDTHKNRQRGHAANPLSEATMGFPTLWIQTDEVLSAGSIIEAIRLGRCFISESPAGPQLYARREGDEMVVRVLGGEGDALLEIGPHGCLDAGSIKAQDVTRRWSIQELLDDAVPFVRFELHTPAGGIRALSNPVWLR